jgi:hypothetical protein
MYQTFLRATSFDQDLSSREVANVTNMQNIFNGVKLSSSNYNAILDSRSKQNVKS